MLTPASPGGPDTLTLSKPHCGKNGRNAQVSLRPAFNDVFLHYRFLWVKTGISAGKATQGAAAEPVSACCSAMRPAINDYDVRALQVNPVNP